MISYWENNKSDITIDNAINLAAALDVPLPEFLGTDLTKNELPTELENTLFSKVRDLSDEDKQVVINVIDSITKKIKQENYDE